MEARPDEAREDWQPRSGRHRRRPAAEAAGLTRSLAGRCQSPTGWRRCGCAVGCQRGCQRGRNRHARHAVLHRRRRFRSRHRVLQRRSRTREGAWIQADCSYSRCAREHDHHALREAGGSSDVSEGLRGAFFHALFTLFCTVLY